MRSVHRAFAVENRLLVSVLLLALGGCGNPVSPDGYTYTVPPQTGDGWVTASLADVGMDSAPLVSLMNELRGRDDHSIHSVLVVRNGHLVFEEYFPGRQFDLEAEDPRLQSEVAFDRNTPQYLGSVTKSVTSALVGIAIDRGLVSGTGARLFSLFPEYAALSDAQKDGITLAQLLTMTAGWAWHDDDIDGEGSDEVTMFQHEDPVRFILERPLSREPGTAMEYHSGYAVLLGEVVRRASGMDLHAFAQQYLFGPLGITASKWAHCAGDSDVAFAGGGLYLRPRDMAKIGQLYLQDGVWDGNVVVSQQWVRQSVQTAVVSVDQIGARYRHTGYGYLWWPGEWTGALGSYMAAGWGGQFIIVVPSKSLVVIVTGGYYDVDSMGGSVGGWIFDDIVYGSVLAAVH